VRVLVLVLVLVLRAGACWCVLVRAAAATAFDPAWSAPSARRRRQPPPFPRTPCLRPMWQVGGQPDEPDHDGAARRVPLHATRAAGHTTLWQLRTKEAF
jgi:hypothetical protein